MAYVHKMVQNWDKVKETLDPEFVAKFENIEFDRLHTHEKVATALKSQPLVLTEGMRSAEDQNKYVKLGYTNLAGGRSLHQYGFAADFDVPALKTDSEKKDFFQKSGWMQALSDAGFVNFINSKKLTDIGDWGHIELVPKDGFPWNKKKKSEVVPGGISAGYNRYGVIIAILVGVSWIAWKFYKKR